MNSNLEIPITLAIVCLIHLFSILVVSSADKYSADEQAALKKFRPVVQNLLYRDYMNEDHFLIRWLRARDLDISRARSMLGKAVKWRKVNKIDTILNETIHLMFPVIPFYHDAFSYSGNPVSTINIRAYQTRNWILAGKRAELLRSIHQTMEIGEVGVRYVGERLPTITIRQIIVIFDFTGYNQRQQGCLACISVYQEWIRHYENYYPQLFKYTIYVNTPRIIKPLLNAVKPILSKHTRQGQFVYGQNKEEWRREIFKLVPRNQLRRGLGGTKSDYIPCAIQDFVCLCKVFLKSAGQGTNTTISLSAGLRKIDADIC